MGIFTALALFLKPLSNLWSSIILFFGFSHCDGWLIWNLAFVFPPIYIFLKQEAMAGKFHVHNHAGVLKIVNMNGNIFQIYILLIRISRGTSNCVQHVFEKKHLFHNDISPILNSYSPRKA